VRCPLLFVLVVLATTTSAVGQNATPTSVVEKAARDAAIDALIGKIVAQYVLPENATRITQALQSAARAGQYDGKTPQAFVEAVNITLRAASHDKHMSVSYEPTSPAPRTAATAPAQRERFNYGFAKLERLRGNIALLELTSFADLTQQSAETASTLLSTLVNFDAIILDLRRNSGGNTPMVAFIASYFFTPASVHLGDLYWRDIDQTTQFWTEAFVPGQRSSRQPVYVLTSAGTFSAAEQFCFALQTLKRATIVGETTGGGAHSLRGPQRLTGEFTALIPVGRWVSPLTKTNWEGIGVIPDVKASAEASLGVATELALKALIDMETDAQWKQGLQQTLTDRLQSHR